jgi:hypothetical protein
LRRDYRCFTQPRQNIRRKKTTSAT